MSLADELLADLDEIGEGNEEDEAQVNFCVTRPSSIVSHGVVLRHEFENTSYRAINQYC